MQEQFNDGFRLFESGNFTEAKSQLDDVLAKDPNHLNAYKIRAVSNVKLGLYAEALSDFENALKIDPGDEFSQQNQEMLLRADRVEANFDKGVNAMDAGKFELAIAYFNRVLTEAPQNAEAYGNRGNALIELRQYHFAILDYERAITIEPENQTFHHNRLILLRDYPILAPITPATRYDFGPLDPEILHHLHIPDISEIEGEG